MIRNKINDDMVAPNRDAVAKMSIILKRKYLLIIVLCNIVISVWEWSYYWVKR